MNTQKLVRTLAAGVATLSASAAFAQAVIVAPVAPPALRVEVVPPRAGYAWDPGHWRWADGRYVWVAGHWQTTRPGYRWVPGHWLAGGPNGRWVPAHWVL